MKMTLEKATKMVEEEYEKAKNIDYIRNPLAAALYKVWKLADRYYEGKDKKNEEVPDQKTL